jgi:hypothetical protein
VPDLRQVGLQGFVDAEGQPLHRRTKLRIHPRLVAAGINAVPLYPLSSWVVIGIPLNIRSSFGLKPRAPAAITGLDSKNAAPGG